MQKEELNTEQQVGIPNAKPPGDKSFCETLPQ